MKQDLIKAYGMLPNDGTVLCAVSGGADSMALLVWLEELSEQYGFSLAAAHFNHGLRRGSALRDEKFVEAFCKERKIPFYAGRGDVAAAAEEKGWSVEEAGRNLRYAFLEKTAEDIGAVRIATAHNRGDNAETVLMNLVRGTGLTGLGGIAPMRGKFIRPLLDTGREEIEAYLEEKGVSHVEDETNGDPAFTRNRIRSEIFPLLKELNPRAEESIAKTAALLRQEDAYLDALAQEMCRYTVRAENQVSLPRERLRALPEVLLSRVLRRMLEDLHASKKDMTARHIRAMEELIANSGPTAQLSLPHGVTARNEGKNFSLVLKKEPPCEKIKLPKNGNVSFGIWEIRCRESNEKASPAPGRLIFRAEAMDGDVTAEFWRGSGRITLPDGSSRSMKRMFLDAGLSLQERERTPVIYADGRIAGALGVAVDRDFTAAKDQKKYILDFYKR